MKAFLVYTYFVLRIVLLILFFIGIVWVGKNPKQLGIWYGEWQKGQIESFNKR